MVKNYFFIALLVIGLFSCNLKRPNDKQYQGKIEKIDKQRCSFDLAADLNLEKIDASFDVEGYFKIASYKSNNLMQLFVYNSQVDVDQKLGDQIHALNFPDVFKAKSIDTIYHLGSYEGKGVIMKGTYEGGVVTGTIKIFCFGTGEKGFLTIRQTINNGDTYNFDLIENSFLLK